MILWYSHHSQQRTYLGRGPSFVEMLLRERGGGGGGDLLSFCPNLESYLQQNTIEGFHM